MKTENLIIACVGLVVLFLLGITKGVTCKNILYRDLVVWEFGRSVIVLIFVFRSLYIEAFNKNIRFDIGGTFFRLALVMLPVCLAMILGVICGKEIIMKVSGILKMLRKGDES